MLRPDRELANRLALVAAAVAIVWFALAAAWSMFGIPGGGHIGAGSCSTAALSEMLLRWKMVYPAWGGYTPTPPPYSLYYCHHPFGIFWVDALLIALFGTGDFVVFLGPVIMSALTPLLLYKLARFHWGNAAGAAAACSFVVVPIAVGFSSYNNLEVIVMFGATLFFWGHSRYQASRKIVHLIASLTGLVFAVAGDWVGYLMVAPALAMGLANLTLPRPAARAIPLKAYARWWALSVSIAVGSLALWVWLFQRVDHISEWLGSASSRAGGATMPLAAVLESRKIWIDFCFTPPVIFLGKVALPVCIARLVLIRRDEELYALATLFAAVAQYVGFKSGADVHIFWPQYFALYYALAMAQLVASLGGVLSVAVDRYPSTLRGHVAVWLPLACAVLPAAVVAPDAIRTHKIFRLTGGRYNDNGAITTSDVDMLVVVKRILKPNMPDDAALDVHPSARWYWEHTWALHRDFRENAMPLANQTHEHSFWIGRGSRMSAELQKSTAEKTHVRVYGDTWVVDEREAGAPLDAYAVTEREPNLLEWYFTNGTEPVRTLGAAPDPFLTWEWRIHLGQPADSPTAEPRTLAETRIAYNAAIDRKDADRARELRARIESQLAPAPVAAYTNGTRLIGRRVVSGVNTTIEVWFEAGDKPVDSYFRVRSVVEKKNPWSWIPIDTVEREMAHPASIQAKTWRVGFLYTVTFAANHRVGTERYFGYFSDGPSRVDGRPSTDLATLD